jgi:hypothetical protein
VGFVVDKVALGQVFSEYFGFPCQSTFYQFLHNGEGKENIDTWRITVRGPFSCLKIGPNGQDLVTTVMKLRDD